MPLKKCSKDGKSGWKYGDSGKCYTGPGAKKKAIKQGLAIDGKNFESNGHATVQDIQEAETELSNENNLAKSIEEYLENKDA